MSMNIPAYQSIYLKSSEEKDISEQLYLAQVNKHPSLVEIKHLNEQEKCIEIINDLYKPSPLFPLVIITDKLYHSSRLLLISSEKEAPNYFKSDNPLKHPKEETLYKKTFSLFNERELDQINQYKEMSKQIDFSITKLEMLERFNLLLKD